MYFVYVKWKHFYVFEIYRICSNMSIRGRSRRMKWVGHVARLEDRRGAYVILVGRPEGKRQHGIPSLRWQDNIKTDLQELVLGFMEWIDLAQVRDRLESLLKTLMNLQVENCALLSHYATSSGNILPTFRDNLSVPSPWVDIWRWAR